jgi:hypothetical protein
LTFTYAGFPLTTNATQWAQSSGYLGGKIPEVAARGSMLVAINGAATRTCTVAIGTASACGVMVKSDAVSSVVFDDVTTAGQTRWDAVVLRRDWSVPSAAYAIVKGTAAAAAPQVIPTLNDNPGTLHDQPLALVQITNGNTIPTQVVNLRLPATKVYTADTLAALPTATTVLYGTEVVLADGSRWRCMLDGSNNPAWITTSSGSGIELTQTGVLLNNAGWSGGGLLNHAYIASDSRMVDLDIELRRTAAGINANNTTGNFPDTLICNVVPALQPLHNKIITAVYAGGTTFDWYPCVVAFDTTGALTLLSGMPAINVETRTVSGDISVRVCLSYARKAQ